MLLNNVKKIIIKKYIIKNRIENYHKLNILQKLYDEIYSSPFESECEMLCE